MNNETSIVVFFDIWQVPDDICMVLPVVRWHIILVLYISIFFTLTFGWKLTILKEIPHVKWQKTVQISSATAKG